MLVDLIIPPQPQLTQPRAYIPLGLAYIGAVLEKSNVDVEITNLADARPEQITIDAFPEAELHGITCTTATLQATAQVSMLLKSHDERVVVGGIHPTIQPKETLRETCADHVITGEAEYAARDLALGKTKDRIVNAGVVEELDELPFPAWHLFDCNDLIDTTGIHGQEMGVPGTTAISSRGCPFDCSFCCKTPMTGPPVRFHSPKRMVDELDILSTEYGVKHIRFVDDIFALNRSRIRKFCGLKESRGVDVTWVCITRGDTLDSELLTSMRKAGCLEVHIGVESGSQRVLDLMNKRTTVERNLRAVKLIKEAGIRAKTYLMWGFPEETQADVEATKEFVRKAQPDKYTLSNFTPLPGSAVYSGVEASGAWFYPDTDPRYKELKDWLKSEEWRSN